MSQSLTVEMRFSKRLLRSAGNTILKGEILNHCIYSFMNLSWALLYSCFFLIQIPNHPLYFGSIAELPQACFWFPDLEMCFSFWFSYSHTECRVYGANRGVMIGVSAAVLVVWWKYLTLPWKKLKQMTYTVCELGWSLKLKVGKFKLQPPEV